MADELLRSLPLPLPRQGLIEGRNPAAAGYPVDAAPELENFRITRDALDVRKGMAAWKSIGGSGTVHHLARVYRKDGTNYTLAARGGTLYQQTGSGAFGAATNGTGLGTSPAYGQYHGVMAKDAWYFTDRTGALRKWDPTNGVQTVTQGTAPTVAPTTKRRTFRVFAHASATDRSETWQANIGSQPSGWNDTADLVLTRADNTSDSVPDFPGGGQVAKMAIATGAKQDDIALSATTAISLDSHDLAFFFQQDNRRYLLAFEVGVNKAGEFSVALDPPEADQAYLVHLPLGNLPQIKYARFRCRRVVNGKTCYVSRLYLPGKLLGKYQYRYSFGNTSTGIETELSPASEFVDCSQILTDYRTFETAALEKSVELTTGTQTLPSVTTHPKVNWYRRGGLPELTNDGRGNPKWLRLARTGNINSSVATAASAGDTVLDVVAGEGAENLAAGDWIVIEPGVVGKEELVKVASVTQDHSVGKDRITLDASTPLLNAHSVSTSNKVQPAYLDNTANEAIDTTTNTLPERDDPPSGGHWLVRLPDGRLALCRTDEKLEIALSNLPTVDHPYDHEVFPDGVDPITRGSLLQGFRFYLDGDASGEEITWAGLFQRTLTVMTNRAVYQCHFTGQQDYTRPVKVLTGVGCIAGHTVAEVNGALYWVADGPRVMRWDGERLDEVGHERITSTLQNAPAAYVSQWFALGRADGEGARYDLFLTPFGATTNTKALSYNAVLDAWESHVYRASSTALPWACAIYQAGPGDSRELYAAHPTSGDVRQLEAGSDDNGEAISVAWATPRIFFDGLLIRAEHCFGWYQATGADTLSFRVRMGDSEYRNTTDFASTDGDPAQSWNETLADTDSSEAELYQRLNFYQLKGRSFSLRVTGNLSNRPSLNRVEVRWSPVRRGRISA